jgi:hypothetical protein
MNILLLAVYEHIPYILLTCGTLIKGFIILCYTLKRINSAVGKHNFAIRLLFSIID